MDRWELLRDIGTWGSGLGLIFWEAHLARPSELMVGAGLVLIAPRVYKHVKALLPGRTAPPSPPPSRSPGSSGPSGPEGTDE